ncbi:MAG: 50S ribosomal protein L29 [Alphaproteobacteria bacterium]|nr:50S ribosomal protein L29 [Alphaproteobacteria bacterium]
MKAEDFKAKTKDELVKLMLDLKKQQFNLRLQKSQGQASNTAQVRVIRRDLARVQTFLNQQASGAQNTTGTPGPKKTKKAVGKKTTA